MLSELLQVWCVMSSWSGTLRRSSGLSVGLQQLHVMNMEDGGEKKRRLPVVHLSSRSGTAINHSISRVCVSEGAEPHTHTHTHIGLSSLSVNVMGSEIEHKRGKCPHFPSQPKGRITG